MSSWSHNYYFIDNYGIHNYYAFRHLSFLCNLLIFFCFRTIVTEPKDNSETKEDPSKKDPYEIEKQKRYINPPKEEQIVVNRFAHTAPNQQIAQDIEVMSLQSYFRQNKVEDTSIVQVNRDLYVQNSQPLSPEEEERRTQAYLSRNVTFTREPKQVNLQDLETQLARKIYNEQTAHLKQLGEERHKWRQKQEDLNHQRLINFETRLTERFVISFSPFFSFLLLSTSLL